MSCKRLIVLAAVVMLGVTSVHAQSVPKPLQTRLVVGDPIGVNCPFGWSFRRRYDRVWQTALNTLLEHNYDIATMEKPSGYLRTTWNERVGVTLKDNWFYKLQISIKLVTSPTMQTSSKKYACR